MILVIDALNKHLFTNILEDMYQLRARVFGGRLGWEVNVEDGKEIDDFDHLDPAYVVGLDDDGNVVSCVRALQTTGPHMLSDVFSAILDGEPPIRSASVWESTRFCVDTNRLTRGKDRNSVSYATCELMIGSLEFARQSGIKDIVTVIDPVMDRVLKRSDNAPYGYVGKKVGMGKVPALAALLDCSEDRISRVRDFSGINHDVFIDEEAALSKFGAKTPEVEKVFAPTAANKDDLPRSQLENYLFEQLDEAINESERQAALRLMDALSGTLSSEQKNAMRSSAGRVLAKGA
ncbi:autoinducer synthase [Ruegeria sp. 2012CJ41-6]|uniref:Acyl-homoserine-lactone synthase n=1 Tax=Ruegeria spongiae TaxID=2942209 RepID=A0ABT0PZS7_9RHOB|nr:acyl-homoserine-lactone synthase [Ruegeria spongiae]MCL6283133.1 autoinducer synthase [Ruegeria spongiae]